MYFHKFNLRSLHLSNYCNLIFSVKSFITFNSVHNHELHLHVKEARGYISNSVAFFILQLNLQNNK